MKFLEFVDQKERKAKKHLELVKEMLEQSGFRITDKLGNHNDPYIYVFSPDANLSFDGVRIYEIGGGLAYRVQKEATTHPYGKAYPIPIEQMFEDLMGDDMKDEEVGKEIIKSVVSEMKDFFRKSVDAEENPDTRKDPLDQTFMKTSVTDYSNSIYK